MVCCAPASSSKAEEREESVGKVFWTPQGDAGYVASIAGRGTPSLTGLEFTLEWSYFACSSISEEHALVNSRGIVVRLLPASKGEAGGGDLIAAWCCACVCVIP